MRILCFSDEFPPAVTGGAAIVAYDFATALLKKGHEIFVITASQDRSRAGESEIDGIKVFTFYSKYPVFLRHYFALRNPLLTAKIEKTIKNVKPDIVHAHNIHTHISYYSLKLAKKNGAKVFLTAHDTMLVSYDKVFFKQNSNNYKISALDNIKVAGKRYNPFRNIAIKYYLRYVDKVFAISAVLKKFLAQNGIESEVLYNGIDSNTWIKPPEDNIKEFKEEFGVADKRIVFFGGRLSGAKGGLQIIKAFASILKTAQKKDIVLFIAGKEPSNENKIKKAVEKHGIEKNVIFSGWLSREEMKTAFFSSNVCVTPSIYFDPFNLFNVEAMAAGKPVVGTCFGGTPEIVIDNETGYIVNPLNDKLMADKILNLLEDKTKAETFGGNGRKRVEENFSLSKQIDKLFNFYNG